MKAETKNILLKLAFLAALGSLYSAAVIIVKSIVFSGLLSFFDQISVILCVYGGYLSAALLGKFQLRGKVIIYTLTGLIPAFAGVIAYRVYGSERIICEIVLMEAMYFTGIRSFNKNYTEITGLKWTLPAIITVVLGSIVPLALKISDYTIFRPIVFLYIYLFVVLSVILENQKNIDYLVTEMAGQTPKLPIYIRRFNLVIVTVATLTISLLAFTGPFIRAIRSLLRKFGRGISTIIVKLFKIIFSVKSGSGGTIPEIPESSRSKQIKTLDEPGLDERIVYLVLVILTILILIFIIARLPKIFREVKRAFGRLYAFIKAKLSIKTRQRIITKVFSDEVEFSKDFYVEEVLKDEGKSKKFKRNFQNEDPVLQVRYYYGVVLDMLLSIRVKIKRSDTAGQIHGKAVTIEEIDEPLSGLTEIYNRVRYGGEIPAADTVEKAKEGCRQIKTALSSDSQKSRTKRKKKQANIK